VIKKGDPLPGFTAEYSGFVNGENSSVVTSLNFSLSPVYSGAAGMYQIIPSASATNYSFIPVNGTLYVNPYGPGTKNVKTSLVCVEQIQPDPNGFKFIANFRYENPNSTAVFVPKGPDNLLTGLGLFENMQQPELFLPGVGTWQARFDGKKLTWSVTTYNGSHKTSVASNASSTSNKCSKSTESLAQNELSSIPFEEMVAYPNPTSDKVYIVMGDRVVSERDVIIYDISGRIVIAEVNSLGSGLMVVDLSGLASGVYFIKLISGTEQKQFRIIRR
jgi:hypothetical protein